MLRLQPFCLNWGTFCKYFKSNTGAVLAASQSPGCSSHRLVSVPAAGQPLVWTSKTIKRLKNRPRECVHGHLQEWGTLPPGCRSIANLLAIQPCSNQVHSRCATTYKGMDGWTDRRMDGQWLYCQPSLRTFCFSLGSHTALWQSQLPNKTVCISGSPVGLISCRYSELHW